MRDATLTRRDLFFVHWYELVYLCGALSTGIHSDAHLALLIVRHTITQTLLHTHTRSVSFVSPWSGCWVWWAWHRDRAV